MRALEAFPRYRDGSFRAWLFAIADNVTANDRRFHRSDIIYYPSHLTIPADVPVTITLTNTGQARHTFNIDALAIHVGLEPGTMTSITIVALAGTYDFYCDVPNHKAAGMVGKLIVEAPIFTVTTNASTPAPVTGSPIAGSAAVANTEAEGVQVPE